MRMVITIVGALALSVAAAAAQPKPTPEAKPAAAIQDGSKVRIQYTLKDDAGTVLDTNAGRDPLTYTQGQHQVIPGLEKALLGMHVGEEKNVTVKPEDGYGVVNPKAQIEVGKEQIPPNALKVGTQLQGHDANGRPIPARVKEIKEKTVVLDMNHPLAGKTLHFDVKIVSVEQPAK